MMPKLKRIWEHGGLAIESAIQGTDIDILKAVTALEDGFAAHPWGETTRALLEND